MLGFDVIGSGARRVVVLNDWLCDTSTWEPARPYLDREAFTWAFADLRGYGRSRGQAGSFSLEEAAGDVGALTEHLGWERFAVVGHSMSTLVALHVAQTRAASVERLVLVTPPPPTGFGYDDATHAALREVALGDDDRRLKGLRVMTEGRLGVGWSRFKVARWRACSDPEAVAAYVAMFGVRGLPDRATPVTCPVLAITGEQDAPPMRGEAAAKSLTPLCARLSIASIVESGHYPMQETPPLFVAMVERFLTSAPDHAEAGRGTASPR